jgi:hypothetical protein
VVEFALPEDIERLRSSKKRDLGVSEKLQLCDGTICGVSSAAADDLMIELHC